MTGFLLRLFIRDYKNTESEEVRQRYGKFSGAVGICTNLLLFALKMTVGLLFNSIAVTADAINNLSDSASSVVTLVGFKMAAKPADTDHPYGHARYEYISGLIVSIVIFIVGFQLAQQAVAKILHPANAEFSPVMLGILVISILLKLWQGAFYRKTGGAIHSSTLSAAAADSMNDVVATSAVLVGTVITRLTGFNLDGYMGLAVAALVLLTGYRLVKETSNPLLGEAPAKEFVDEVYRSILAYDGVLGIHDLNIHNYGPGRCFASVHCEVPAERNVLESHDIIDNIERDFLLKKGIHLVVHMDPIMTGDEKTNALREQVRQQLMEISPDISMHDFRVVWGPTHSNLVFDVCVSFEFPLSDEELTEEIGKRVRSIDEHYYPVITVDHDYVPRSDPGSSTKN